jgi:hypothetical protein
MASVKKTNVKQELNIQKIELFLKKQEQNDRNIKPTSVEKRNV